MMNLTKQFNKPKLKDGFKLVETLEKYLHNFSLRIVKTTKWKEIKHN